MNTRYFGLDFARATLMLLGIFYHSSLIYLQDGQWHVSHPEQSPMFNLLKSFLHYFRMGAFYIIAGFFFVLVVEKYGSKKTLIERIVKLGVPLLFIGMTINTYLSSMHPENAQWWSFEYIIKGQWLHHLWFIGNLICYYLVAIWFVERFTYVKEKADSIKKIAFFALFVAPCLWIIFTWIGVRIIPKKVLFLSFEGALGYFPYFVLGMYFWQQRERCFAAMTPSNALKLSLLSMVLIVTMQTVDLKAISWTLYLVVYGFNLGVMAIAMIMWLNYIGRKSNKLVSKVTESSYTVYLLHEPLIVFVYVAFLATLDLNIYLSFALLCSIVFLTSYFSHFLVVKNNPLLMLLFNGKLLRRKKPQASTKPLVES